MKKELSALIAITMIIGLTACGNNDAPMQNAKIPLPDRLGTESGATATDFYQPDINIDSGAIIATTEVPATTEVVMTEAKATEKQFTETVEAMAPSTEATTTEKSEAQSLSDADIQAMTKNPKITNVSTDYSKFEGVYQGKIKQTKYMENGEPIPEGKTMEADNDIVCILWKGIPVALITSDKEIISSIAEEKEKYCNTLGSVNPLMELTYDETTNTSVWKAYGGAGIIVIVTTTFTESSDGSISLHYEKKHLSKSGSLLLIVTADDKMVSHELK